MESTIDSRTVRALVERINFENSAAVRSKVHRVIPGGTHTYAKGDDQFPERSPGFIARGKGCHVWDIDGNEFIEYGMGLRAVTLGHAYAPVVEAAYRQMLLGNNFNRPALLELECAQMLQSLVPGAEMVKFAKDGSAVLTAGLKLARAYTGRTLVAICGESPFFSYNDWFIGQTPMDGGIPPVSKSMTITFSYNDIGSLERLFEQYPGQIAMVLMEPARVTEPQDGFLHKARETAHRHGAVFMLDETISGFRFHRGGAQSVYGITPDLSCFGKAMANGFSLSALTGRREIMELGGLQHEKERVFLLSTTHGAEYPALAAAIETMRIYRDEPVIEHLYRVGERLREGFKQAVSDAGMENHITIVGRPCNLLFGTRDHDDNPSQAFRTLFLQELIRWGVLAPSFIVSYSHDNSDIDNTVEAIARAARVYAKAIDARSTDGLLIGAPTKPVYRRYN
ncbi:MAG: glutamate-1-semialdehyde 2,1-aminomutase [Lautropia sp.]|nr:glutamate-1-semialdehyde 2,1-aminomutase [Lautropia sp.]